MQFDCRTRRSWLHAKRSITDFMRQEMDRKSSRQASSLDLKKVFDSLGRPVLLNKLHSHRFRGPFSEPDKDSLRNRWHFA